MPVSNKFNLSGKHSLINKDNSTIVISTAVTVVIVIFSIVACRSLIDSMIYQNSVIEKRQAALKILEKNVVSAKALDDAYQAFEASPESKLGTKDKNSKIVLDSLPSKYDYPALATSLGEIAKIAGVSLTSISGTDDELTAQQSSITPAVVEIPLDASVSGSYVNVQKMLVELQRSIRPFSVLGVSFSGSDSAMQATIKLKTYYQPSKIIDLVPKVVPKPGSEKEKPAASGTTSTTSETTAPTGATQ